MARTYHKSRSGEEFPAKSKKKQKDKKFFGYPEDNWARLHGKDGKKGVGNTLLVDQYDQNI